MKQLVLMKENERSYDFRQKMNKSQHLGSREVETGELLSN